MTFHMVRAYEPTVEEVLTRGVEQVIVRGVVGADHLKVGERDVLHDRRDFVYPQIGVEPPQPERQGDAGDPGDRPDRGRA